jgi:hypothetical protein
MKNNPKHVWISLAQAAPRLRLDATSVGRRARRGEFGPTTLFASKGHLRRFITLAGLQRFMARQRKACAA